MDTSQQVSHGMCDRENLDVLRKNIVMSFKAIRDKKNLFLLICILKPKLVVQNQYKYLQISIKYFSSK